MVYYRSQSGYNTLYHHDIIIGAIKESSAYTKIILAPSSCKYWSGIRIHSSGRQMTEAQHEYFRPNHE